MFQRAFTNTTNFEKIWKHRQPLLLVCLLLNVQVISLGSFPSGERTSHPSWRVGRSISVGLPGLSWDQKDNSMCLPFPILFHISQFPRDYLLSGAFSARKGQLAPQETSVDVSCSSLGQEQPLQEATKELQFLPCLLSWNKRIRVALIAVSKDLHKWEYHGLQKLEKRSTVKANGWKQN